MELLQHSDFGWHAEQPNVPQKTAAEIKKFFDAPTHTLMQKTNELINQFNTLVGDESVEGSVASDIQKAIGMVTDFEGIVSYLEQNGGQAAQLMNAVATLQNLVGAKSVADQITASRADYVCETGTDGVWTYRKWNNGGYEAWCMYSVETAITDTDGTIYVYGGEEQAPNFSKSIITCTSDNSASGVASWSASNFVDNHIWHRTFATGAMSSTTVRVCLQLRGKWK